MIHLTIRDNGIGIQPGFNWEDSPSLGFRLVTSLVEQLDGTIRKLPGPEGTGFAITIRRAGSSYANGNRPGNGAR